MISAHACDAPDTPTAEGYDILLLSMAAFASAMALRVGDAMLPAIALHFATTLGQAARVVTAAGVAYGVFQLLFGPLGDHFGKFRVIAWACLVSTAGAFACASSTSLDALTVSRAVNGATTAALIPLSMAWIGDTVELQQRQATLARFLSGQVLGLLGGQITGGFFSDHFGWRWAFVLLGTVYLIVGVLLLASMRRRSHLRVTAGALGDLSALTRIRVVLGNPHARFILVTVYLEAVATFGTLAFIPSYLHMHFGLSLFHAGIVVASFGLGGLGYTLLAPFWVRTLGPVRLALCGGVVLGVAIGLLVVAPVWSWAIFACTLAGLGFYQLHNTLQTMATQMTPGARGTAVSLFASCYFIGQSSGVALTALAIDSLGAHWLFAGAALVLPLLGTVLAVHLHRRAQFSDPLS